jgi:transcriptional regulator with XRE-family HTH domain
MAKRPTEALLGGVISVSSANVPRSGGQGKIGWVFFGSELKRQRERAGLTQDQLGERVYCSGSYIGQFEAAIRKPQLDLAQRFDQELKTNDLFAHMCEELINSSPYAEYFADMAELQPLALTISELSLVLVPGLLQTADYARAIFRANWPFAQAETIDAMVQLRMNRAHLLDGPTAPLLWVIIDESVIRRPVGSPTVMTAQLEHMATEVERTRALVQVIPYSSGAHSMMEGNITLMTFTDAPPLAYVESPHIGQVLDDPALVARCMASYDLARASALPPEASVALIRSAAKEYAHAQ